MNLAAAFKGMDDTSKPPKRSNAQAAKRPAVQTAKRLNVEAVGRSPLPLEGTAKSKHPDWAPKTVYIRKATRRAAERRFEDTDGSGDFSDLVEMLLQKYANG